MASRDLRSKLSTLAVLSFSWWIASPLACTPTAGTTGNAGTGGAKSGATGGGTATGSGGAATPTGGSSSGGAAPSGGTTGSGGAGSGGTTSSGGNQGSGGTLATGGRSPTGGQGSGGVTGGAAGNTPTGGTSASDGVSVLTNRYDNVRNGANTSEKTLTVANVGGGKFGLVFSLPVDGHVYAQPLYVPGLTIGGAKHNVLFIATEHDTVYAFDADAAGAPLWSQTLGTPMNAIPGTATGAPLTGDATISCKDMFPKTGITSTPVIDPATNRIYVVTKNFEGGKYDQRLHALDILSGAEVGGGPVSIKGTVTGTGVAGDGSKVTFDPYHHLNRPGLLLQNGVIFIAFSSHCDDDPYHGWIFAYDAATMTQKGIHNTTPNGTEGGIWQSGMGLVGDGTNVFFVSGNGDFDASNTGSQTGISVGRLQLSASGLTLMDWWTPFNAQSLVQRDYDYTTAAVLLPNPKVIVMGGKDGFLNVIDPTNMGKFNATSDKIIQQVSVGGHLHGGPVYWNGPSGPTIYLWPEASALRSYRFSGNKVTTTAASQFTGETPTHPGGTVSLSANGATAGTGIVWATLTSAKIDTVNQGDAWHKIAGGAIYAFDANNLATPIWMSTTNKTRDDLGNLAKFNAPTVVNGRVYVGTQLSPDGGKIQVYGLLP